MNTQAVIRRLLSRAKKAGSQRKLADKLGVSQQYLSDVIARTKEPGERILRPLGLKRAPPNYVRINGPTQEQPNGQTSEE